MKTITALAVAAVLAIGGTATASAMPATSSDSPQAQVSCRYASIGGKRKCIARGQFCARAYQRDYRRYGYSCSKRDRNGRYHLT